MVSVGINRSAWMRLRTQLGGSILFAAVLPYVIRIAVMTDSEAIWPLHQTLIGSVVAITLGTWLLRNVTTYPGVEASSYILPAFSVSYFALLLVFLIGRFDYNRVTLLAGYVLSVAWFLVVYSRIQRYQGLRIGYLPFGDTSMLPLAGGGVTWVPLSSPDADVSRLTAVATDLRIDVPMEWDRRLADYALAGIPVYHTKHLLESMTGRVELEHLSENSFGTLAPLSAYVSFKHVVDWVAAVLCGLLLLPFLIAVGIAIRATSAGPALFRQQRMGYRGHPFIVYKFRTMSVAVEQEDAIHAAITQSGDMRITPLGRFLRKTRIDELPQILNVLRGEMSWIGPRPEAEVLSRWYEEEIPFYRYRHVVRPGIAGWAQVCQGHVSTVEDVRSKLHYDFYYIKNFSPWMDLLIVARTIRTMFTGFGAK